MLHVTAPSRANSVFSVQVECTGIRNKPDTKNGEINVQNIHIHTQLQCNHIQ